MISSRILPILAAVAALAATAALSSCQKSDTQSGSLQGETAQTDSPAQALAKKGKAAYLSACIACHNADPKRSGSLGPEVFGSSLELLQKRIMTGTYPEGYKPKRQTHVMQPLPQVEKDIPAIHAYLNNP